MLTAQEARELVKAHDLNNENRLKLLFEQKKTKAFLDLEKDIKYSSDNGRNLYSLADCIASIVGYDSTQKDRDFVLKLLSQELIALGYAVTSDAKVVW